MPKRKTHKGLKKRFKVTANGKIKHRNSGRGHILSSKTPKRKRHLRQDGVITGVRARMIIDGLRASL